jgi:hypothetical protein
LGREFITVAAEPALGVGQRLVALCFGDGLEALQALHGGVESAQLIAMRLEVLEGRVASARG